MKRRLGVNIDHIATLREARGEFYPDPLQALKILKKCKVDQVTMHLREDRRHIQDSDVKRIIEAKILPVNLEIAVAEDMINLACRLKPKMVTFVPEKRHEITTEGGLNCLGRSQRKKLIKKSITKLKKKGIPVSLFLDPHVRQIQSAAELGAEAIEIHTGRYCHKLEKEFFKNGKYKPSAKALEKPSVQKEWQAIETAALIAESFDMKVYAGHGLHVDNLLPITKILNIEEYNIGHAIVARSIFVGLEKAVKEIQNILKH